MRRRGLTQTRCGGHRGPHRLRVMAGSDVRRVSGRAPTRRPRCRLSVDDLQGETLAIGREQEIDPGRERGPQRRRLPLVIHPVDRKSAADALPGQIHQRAAGRHSKLRRADSRVRAHAFERGHRRPRHRQPVQIEGRRKERPVVEVHQMAARQIAAVIGSALHDRARARRQRLHHEIRVSSPARLVKSTALPPGSTWGQPLGEASRSRATSAVLASRRPRTPASSCVGRGVGRKHDRAVLAHAPPRPFGASHSVTAAPPVTADLLQLAVREKPDPLAVRRKERTVARRRSPTRAWPAVG